MLVQPLGVLHGQTDAAVGGRIAQGIQRAAAQAVLVVRAVDHRVEHDVAGDFEGILGPTVELFKVVPAVDGMAVQEHAPGRAVVQAGGAGEGLLQVVLPFVVQRVDADGLAVDAHLDAVGEGIRTGLGGEQQVHRIAVGPTGGLQAVGGLEGSERRAAVTN